MGLMASSSRQRTSGIDSTFRPLRNVTSQGHPYASFRRSLYRRDLSGAWAAAHEIPVVSLADGLTLKLLIREAWPVKYPRAAAKCVGRYAAETKDATIEEAMLVASHLSTLVGGTDPKDVQPLSALLKALRREQLVEIARTRASPDPSPTAPSPRTV
jgi:hypothetical protein